MFVQRSSYCRAQLGLLLLLLTFLFNVNEFAGVEVKVCMQPIYFLHVNFFPFLYDVCFYDHLLPWELLPHGLAIALVLRLFEKVGDV